MDGQSAAFVMQEAEAAEEEPTNFVGRLQASVPVTATAFHSILPSSSLSQRRLAGDTTTPPEKEDDAADYYADYYAPDDFKDSEKENNSELTGLVNSRDQSSRQGINSSNALAKYKSNGRTSGNRNSQYGSQSAVAHADHSSRSAVAYPGHSSQSAVVYPGHSSQSAVVYPGHSSQAETFLKSPSLLSHRESHTLFRRPWEGNRMSTPRFAYLGEEFLQNFTYQKNSYIAV